MAEHPQTQPGQGGPAPSHGASTTPFDPHRLWQLLRRRRFFLLLPLIVIVGVVFVGLRGIEPLYVSFSKLMLEQQGTGTTLDRQINPERRRLRDRERFTQIRETFRSEGLLRGVIQSLGLAEDPLIQARARAVQETALPEQSTALIAERLLVGRLRNKIDLDMMGADIYRLKISDNDPETAYKLCEAITEAFRELVAAQRARDIGRGEVFTEEQLQTAQRELSEAESALAFYRRQILGSGELSGNPVGAQNVQRAEQILRLVRLDLQETRRDERKTEDNLVRVWGSVPSVAAIEEDPWFDDMRDRLAALQREDYLSELGPSTGGSMGISPERQRIGTETNRLNRRLQETVDQAYPNLPASTRRLLSTWYERRIVGQVLSEHEARIAREMDLYQNSIRAKPGQDAELRRLETRVSQADEAVKQLRRTRDSARIARHGEQSGFGTRVRVLEPAFKPVAPSEPSKIQMALMAVLLGLGIGLGAVFLAEYLDTSFRDVDDAKKATGLEVLGTLPRFTDRFDWERKKRRQTALWRTAFALTLVTLMVLLVLYYRRSTGQDRVNLVRSAVTAPATVDSSK